MRTLTAALLGTACSIAVGSFAHAADGRTTYTLTQVLSRALKVESLGEIGRARYALEQAAGAVEIALGAFDWSLRSSTGYNRIYQYGQFGGFLTTDVQSFNVLSSTVYAERQFANGIRVRPGVLVTKPLRSARTSCGGARRSPRTQSAAGAARLRRRPHARR